MGTIAVRVKKARERWVQSSTIGMDKAYRYPFHLEVTSQVY